MKKYLGTKLVTAKPMTRAEAEVILGKSIKPADNFLDRLIIERDEVQQRLSSLTSALMQEDFQEKVGSKQYYWMQEQRNAMEIYVEVLNKRITHAINNK